MVLAAKRITIASGASSVGVLNLSGGTLNVASVVAGAGNSTFNFNGGTLSAVRRPTTTFLQGHDHAYVNAGGAIIDTNGNDITINQALLAPTSTGGLIGGTVTASGSNYISPPLVTVNGNGTGATAYATLDEDGHVNGIVVGNPGTGYTNATFSIARARATSPAPAPRPRPPSAPTWAG